MTYEPLKGIFYVYELLEGGEVTMDNFPQIE
jgi:hypothetical protein